MGYPLKRSLRSYYRKRLLTALVWFALCLAVWLGSIEAFYGPGKTVWTELWENAPYLLGAACAVAAMGILVSFGRLMDLHPRAIHADARVREAMDDFDGTSLH